MRDMEVIQADSLLRVEVFVRGLRGKLLVPDPDLEIEAPVDTIREAVRRYDLSDWVILRPQHWVNAVALIDLRRARAEYVVRLEPYHDVDTAIAVVALAGGE